MNHHSAVLRELLSSEPFRRIATFTDDDYVQQDPTGAADCAEGLLKRVGVVEGASDMGWHKDCTMGGHSRNCSSLVVGISVNGGGPDTGELAVVAGSNRANVAPSGVRGLELPRIALPIKTGDVTVHCSCTLHMSTPPRSGERRVVYTGFSLAPTHGAEVPDTSPAERRRERAHINDEVLAHHNGVPVRNAL
jgi:hypothetical protein